MSDSIRLSPQHGVNPSITTCFFCGEETGVALMGRMKGDAKAPDRVCVDYEPCDKCKAAMAQGYTLIGVTHVQPSDGRPPITHSGGKPYYPDGTLLVVNEKVVNAIFEPETAAEVMAAKKAFVPIEIARELLKRVTGPQDAEYEQKGDEQKGDEQNAGTQVS